MVNGSEIVTRRPANPTVARFALGRWLRELKERDGRSGNQLAKAVNTPPATMNRWLSGRNQDMKPHQLLGVLAALGYGPTSPVGLKMMELVQNARTPDVVQSPEWAREAQFDLFVALEEVAQEVMTYEPTLIPGILQTPAYAAAVFGDRFSGDALEERVRLRAQRQEVLDRADDPLMYRIVIDEAVLLRRIVNPAAQREQLEHLLTTAALPNVDLRVIPFARGPYVTGCNGSFVIMRSADDFGDVAYVETPEAATYFATREAFGRYQGAWDRVMAHAAEPDTSAEMISDRLAT